MEPGIPQPDYHRSRIAPLTLRYGSQPPVTSGQRDIDLLYETMAIAWLPPDPQPQPNLKRDRIAPLRIVYGQQPPPAGGMSDPDILYPTILQWQPPPPQPPRDRGYIVAQTLVYGSQPPVTSGQRDIDLLYQTIAAWQPAWIAPQTLPGTAAWNFVTVVTTAQPFVAYPLGIIASWQPAPLPPPSPVKVVPLTFTYGDQPPPVSGVKQAIISSWVPQDSYPYQAKPSAAPFGVVIVAQPPFTGLQRHILAAWQSEQAAEVQRARAAPLTLVYGDQPPRQSKVNERLIIESWQPPFVIDFPLVTLVTGAPPPTFTLVDRWCDVLIVNCDPMGRMELSADEFGRVELPCEVNE
jgi:hypothetical protein